MLDAYQQTGTNFYDVREKCEQDQCYPALHFMKKYLNREEVKRKLGVKPSIHFENCNNDIFDEFAMTGDKSV